MTEMTSTARAFLHAQLANLKAQTREHALIIKHEQSELDDKLLMVKYLEFDLLVPGDLKVAA